jgi:hypothetical protein
LAELARYNLKIKELIQDQNTKLLYDFVLANTDYFTDYQQISPSIEEIVDEFFLNIPAEVRLENKKILAIYQDEQMIGFVDLLYHYPDKKACCLGLFVLDSLVHHQGLGQDIYSLIEEMIWKDGFSRIFLGCLLRINLIKKCGKSKAIVRLKRLLPLTESR